MKFWKWNSPKTSDLKPSWASSWANHQKVERTWCKSHMRQLQVSKQASCAYTFKKLCGLWKCTKWFFYQLTGFDGRMIKKKKTLLCLDFKCAETLHVRMLNCRKGIVSSSPPEEKQSFPRRNTKHTQQKETCHSTPTPQQNMQPSEHHNSYNNNIHPNNVHIFWGFGQV